MFLLPTVLFISCEQDDTVNKQEVKVKSRFTTLKINELPTAFRSNSFMKKVENLRENRLSKNANSSTGLQIDTDHIGMFDNGNEKTFTFKVTTDSISSSFFNLLVRTDATYKILNSDLLEYVPDPAWLANTQQPFSGQLFVNRITSLNNEVTDLLSSFSLQKSSGQCITGVSTGWICDAGRPHDPSVEAAGNCNGGAVFYFNFQYGPCQGSVLDNEVPAFDIDAGNPHNGGGTNTNTSGGGRNAPGRPCDPLVVPDCGNGSMPILIDLPALVDQETQDFFDSLDTPLKNHINDADQNELRDDVDQFLIEENHDQPAKDFAKEAIKAKEESEDNEVDFENKSIYDPSVPECLKEIIERFKPEGGDVQFNTNQFNPSLQQQLNIAGNTLDLFNNNGDYGLTFEMKPIAPNAAGNIANAKTNAKYNSNNGVLSLSHVTINIDPGYLSGATDLAVARTIVHELVHAYLFYIQDASPNSTLGLKMDELLTDSTQNQAQHSIMAEQFAGAIAGAIQAWDNSNNIDEVYTLMSWSGEMMSSFYFNQLNPVMQQRIEQRNAAEENRLILNPNIPTIPPLGNNTCN